MFGSNFPNLNKLTANRHCQLGFDVRADSLLHGFIVYYELQLFKTIHISNLPATASHGIYSVFPLYLPLFNPLQVAEKERLEINVWKTVEAGRVW